WSPTIRVTCSARHRPCAWRGRTFSWSAGSSMSSQYESAVATAIAPDRQMPSAPEAEISVLGGMLIDGDAVARAMEIVDDTMFYREANRRVFRAMSRLFQRGQVIDPVTVGEELKKTDELDGVGGLGYIAELLDAVP